MVARAKRKNKNKQEGLSISGVVNNYIVRYPSLGECLRKGVINHSALARIIRQENPSLQMSGLIAAVRRSAIRKLGKEGTDSNLDKVFQHSRLSAQGGIALVICSNIKDFALIAALKVKATEQREVFLFMEGILNFTIVTSQPFLNQVKKALSRNISASYENLSLLSISLPYSSVHTHGVSARLTGLLAAAGVPILQEMTSAGEYFIVLATQNLTIAIETLERRRRS